jgi:hypothetical protein
LIVSKRRLNLEKENALVDFNEQLRTLDLVKKF